MIPDSAERVNKGLELGGKTEQVQTTGANLLPFPYVTGDMTKNGVTFAVQEDGGIKVTGTATELVFFYIAKIDFGANNIFNNSAGNGKVLSGGKDNVKIEYNGLSKNTYLAIAKGLTVNTVIYPQLQNGTAATPYEPYTGGKPSPSPEYPQEIVNVGKYNKDTGKYEVDVKVTGKNLFDREKAKDNSNWIFKDGDGYAKFPIYVKKGNKITFSYTEKLTTGKNFYVGIAYSEAGGVIAWLYHASNLSISHNKYTVVATGDYVYLMCTRSSIQSFLDTIQTLQVEISPAQTDYQPYAEQTLTLTSDRPLTKWDRLVEQGGQIGWLYNSVNETIDGKTGKWSIQPASKIFYRTDITFPIVVPFCIELLGYDYLMGGCKKDTGITINNLGILCITLPEEVELTLDAYKQYLADNPLHVLYKGDSEEFIPLPQSEQNAIRALKTYYPTTVITADGGELDPDIKATYTADTKNYIDGKVSANVASILRQYQADTVNLLSLMPMETQAAMIENDTNRILENVEEMKYE